MRNDTPGYKDDVICIYFIFLFQIYPFFYLKTIIFRL